MSVPGSNLLAQASQLIALQTISWLQYASQTTESNLMVAPTYNTPVTVQGSVQPVPRRLMEMLGLDMQRNYINIFTPNNVIDIQRDISSDQFQINGTLYQGISSTAWYMIDGWNEILAVQVPS